MFLFDSLGSKIPSTSRKTHIRRLVDVLQVCIHRHDWPRAQRAWCILSRCKEFEWKNMWKTGLLLAGPIESTTVEDDRRPQRLEYLRVMMLRSSEHRISILQEIVVHLINSGLHQEALDELELYLPSFPYQDSPVLHIYAGLLRLFLAQTSGSFPAESPHDQSAEPHTTGMRSPDHASIRECKYHFHRALDLDPGNPVASGFIARLDASVLQNDLEDESGPSDMELETEHNLVDKRPHKKPRRPKG